MLKSSSRTFYNKETDWRILTGVRCCWLVSLSPLECSDLLLKVDLLWCFSPFPSVWSIGSLHVIDSESLKAQRPYWQELLSPTEKTAPESPHLYSRHWFCDFVTSHINILKHATFTIYAYIHGRIDANGKLKTQQSRLETQWEVLAQACVSCPIRTKSGFRRGGSWNRAETEGEYRAAAMDSMRKLMCF